MWYNNKLHKRRSLQQQDITASGVSTILLSELKSDSHHYHFVISWNFTLASTWSKELGSFLTSLTRCSLGLLNVPELPPSWYGPGKMVERHIEDSKKIRFPSIWCCKL
ncbi:hypothetical protein SADUNF_Sadunf16G0161600 [Salix dunnii]|uniref:Uncharacterized protein n=1 Tax=Salix dunnii TaxID=1413687 RepID=A0A835JA15_9ROSI|nr:hypothetical protein SADUNF_Sadunf16G0161600 [Salix dunnii]